MPFKDRGRAKEYDRARYLAEKIAKAKKCIDCGVLVNHKSNQSGMCKSCQRLGDRHHGFVTGVSKYGYKRATINKIRGQEHRRLIEEHIGRRLNRDEVVHHIDGNKTNNSLENLQILSNSEHARLHLKMRWSQ